MRSQSQLRNDRYIMIKKKSSINWTNLTWGIIRRIVHTFCQNNDTFSLRKLLKLRQEIKFPYSITTLSLLLKKLGFRYKKRQRESIIHERPDLVLWRETFLGRVKEIRENEPHREYVYTDETWLHAGHRVKKEWVDLKALERIQGAQLSTTVPLAVEKVKTTRHKRNN